MSYFRFSEISKIFPYQDTTCPPDGNCVDSLQTLVKMSISQDTDLSKKPKNIFDIVTPSNATKFDVEKLTQLVTKNITSTGEIWVEGSIKQVRNLMKHNMVVRPSCLFDRNITATFKVSFSQNGKYDEKHTREVVVPLTQIM